MERVASRMKVLCLEPSCYGGENFDGAHLVIVLVMSRLVRSCNVIALCSL